MLASGRQNILDGASRLDSGKSEGVFVSNNVSGASSLMVFFAKESPMILADRYTQAGNYALTHSPLREISGTSNIDTNFWSMVNEMP